MNFQAYSNTELRNLYDMHKDIYYGNKIVDDEIEPITDIEFDELEQFLILNDSTFEPYVGVKEEYGRHLKAKHWFPMLSLSKVHAKELITESNFTDIHKLLKHQEYYLMSWKLDGFGVSVKYDSGSLISIITRGNKSEGADITEKFRKLVPSHISIKDPIEIRAEMLINKEIFNEKYSDKFAHPRNAVVGIKNNIDINDERVNDVSVVAVDAIKMNGEVLHLDTIEDQTEFEVVEYTFCMQVNINAFYKTFLQRRNRYQYPTDGLVLSKTSEFIRQHNGHHPNDMIAIKFPAPTFKTKVTKITSHTKRTGFIIPRIHFEPVIVDGRSITKCAGFNYKYIIDNGINEGAEIEISLSGDIIPVCKTVLKESEIKIELPGNDWNGVHRIDSNSSELVWHKFNHAMHQLNFDGFGGSAYRVLYNTISSFWNDDKAVIFTDIFNTDIINEQAISELGPKQSKNLIKQIQNIKSIPLRKIFTMLSVNGCGNSTAKQLARRYSGLSYDTSGLQKSIVEYFINGKGEEDFDFIQHQLDKYDVKLEKEVEEKQIENSIKYILTGSPKAFGYKTKAEFKSILPEHYQEVSKISEAYYLITDNLQSSSSKMKQAEKFNVNIKTYEYFKNL